MPQSLRRDNRQRTANIKKHIEKNNNVIRVCKEMLNNGFYKGHTYMINETLVSAIFCQKILEEILSLGITVEKYCKKNEISTDSFYRVLVGKRRSFSNLDLYKLIIKFM